MANRFVSPQQQFISFAGQPYAGGFLNFYVSGTSTRTPTFQDEGLSIPNTNPVVLDSAGDAGNIFLDPGILYKVVLTDSNNNPIWTFDPVIPTDSSTGPGFTPIVSCNASGTNSIVLTPITPSQQPALYSNYQVFAFVPVSTSTGAVNAQVGTLPSESVFVSPGVQAGAGTFVINGGPYFLAYGSLVAGSGPGFLLLNLPTNIFDALPSTGHVAFTLAPSAPAGWLMFNDSTFGSAASGASSANIANLALFNMLFASPFTDATCPLLTSTGAATTRAALGSAAAAWAANCRMSLPLTLGRALAVAGSGAGLTSFTMGQTTGENTHLLVTGEMPTHNHGVSDGGHVHAQNASPAGGSSGGIIQANVSGVYTNTGANTGLATTGISIQNAGGGGAHNNMQPSSFMNCIVKQ